MILESLFMTGCLLVSGEVFSSSSSTAYNLQILYDSLVEINRHAIDKCKNKM